MLHKRGGSVVTAAATEWWFWEVGDWFYRLYITVLTQGHESTFEKHVNEAITR